MRKLQLTVLGFFILLVFTGCKKATTVDVASADAIIESTKNPADTSQTLYAIVNAVISYNIMTSATVVAPNSSTMQLTNYANLGNSFYNDPVFTTTPPMSGIYNYTVKFQDGQTIAYSNSLLSTTIAPPFIKSLSKTTAGDSINIVWKAVPNAQAYQLKVTKGTGSSMIEVYYAAPFVDASTPLRSILTYGLPMGSVSSYGAGTYTFEIDAMLYETTAYTYIQAIGVTTQNITL